MSDKNANNSQKYEMDVSAKWLIEGKALSSARSGNPLTVLHFNEKRLTIESDQIGKCATKSEHHQLKHHQLIQHQLIQHQLKQNQQKCSELR